VVKVTLSAPPVEPGLVAAVGTCLGNLANRFGVELFPSQITYPEGIFAIKPDHIKIVPDGGSATPPTP
jgi:hypothetical protein